MWLELIQSDVQFSKSKAPLHPKLIELNFGTELSWICFFKCIVAGPFQLILQIPGPGFEAQGLEFTVFLYWIAYPPIISLKKYVMNTISFFTTSRSTLFLFIEGCHLIIQNLKDWEFIAALYLLLTCLFGCPYGW